MIFSKFFKAKWQHKDSNVRITTINEDLVASNVEDLNILKQLISDDVNELVRRAALIKVNSFEQWLSESLNNTNVKVREYAQLQVIAMLQDNHTIKLSLPQKQAFIARETEQNPAKIGKYTHKSLLESWLVKEQEAELVIALFVKVNKPQLLVSLFAQKNNPLVQQYFIEQTNDLAILEKLIKKCVNDDVLHLVQNKIARINEQTEKPKKLIKTVQLTLSKLLALRDTVDYGVYLTKKALLEKEWDVAGQDFSCLANEERDELTTKYNQIDEQLTKIFAPKKEAFYQQQITQQLIHDKVVAQAEFGQALTDISQSLTTSVFENTLLDESQFSDKLVVLENQIKSSVLNSIEQKVYLDLINQHKKRLTQLPEIAQSVSEATHLISRISQLALPVNIDELSERQPIFNDWLKQWRYIEKKTDGVIPESIQSAYKEIVNAWQVGLRPLVEQQKSIFITTRKKLSDLQRLLSTGKFNASFGIFKRVEQSFTQLSVKQQQDLQRDFDNVSKRIADLSDWEHYIATPRKQQLLDDINALVLCPLDNPNEQAAKVKEYRKNWNLLGHADEELDKSLNDSFNKACEDAFTPCRLFFAEQEKLREQHLKIRIELIEQAKHLALLTAPLDFKVIDGQLNKLSTAWLEVGEVDRAKYKNLQQEFNNVLQPVKQAIRDFNEQNISLKKAIIEQANEALNRDDVNASIETIKQLQTKWRNIGYAGQRYENKLWQSFRAVNDQIFKKRDDCIVDEKIQQTAQLADYENQLSSLKDLLIKATDKEKLKLLKEQTTDLLEQVNNSKPVIKVVSFALENILKEIANQSKKIDEGIANQVWQNIFILMSDIAVGSIVVGQLADNTIYSSLPVSWQKKLFEAMSTKFIEQDSGRACKTLELEILAGIESPADLAKQRMQIQVQLMQDKMSSGNEVNIEQRFSDWLYQGILTEQDVPFINRLKPIFCH